LAAKRKAIADVIRREENKVRLRERKNDTRRKILAGAAVLDEAEHKEEFKAALHKLLAKFLTRPEDRALFGLPPILIPDKCEDAPGETDAAQAHQGERAA
jgi:hypothetical protein